MTHSGSDRRDAWDKRYAETELVWSASPNRFLADEVAGLPPGRALDLGAGEGRNAIWLAEQGWNVTAVDFSKVGIRKARAIAEAKGISANWLVEDLLTYRPQPQGFELVILLYIHLPPEEWVQVLESAAAAVRPAGTLLVIGHDSANIAEGVGGPQDSAVLYSAQDVTRTIPGFEIVRAGQVPRPVTTDEGERNAIDVLVRAIAPAVED